MPVNIRAYPGPNTALTKPWCKIPRFVRESESLFERILSMKKLLVIAALIGVVSAANAQTVWYGGDFDGVNGYISNSGPNAFGFQGMAYDDFTWNSSQNATFVGGTLFNGLASDTSINWEIRSGLSAS